MNMLSLKEFAGSNEENIRATTTQMMRLLKLCEKLPAETLKVLELHYMQQKPLKEVCEIMGKSMTTIRNHRDRGLMLLRQYQESDEANTNNS